MQISDFIALTALATSLFSIWLQNRGVRKQLLVTNISEYTKRYQEIFEKLPKSVIDENFDINTFSEDEREKIIRPMWLYFDLCYEEYILYHELHLIDKKLWKYWEKGMTSAFSRPSFHQCWKLIFNNSFYPRPFSKFVNDKMITLHHRSKNIS